MSVIDKKIEDKKDDKDVNETKKEDMLIKRIENKDYVNIKNDIEDVITKKVYDRVQEKKEEFINKINDVVIDNNEDKKDEE